jgi:hypothetical protein
MPKYEEWSQSDLLAKLRDVDNSDARVSDWEARFMNTVLAKKYQYAQRLSPAQKESIIRILRKHG